jgi:hypothetical protein
MNYRLLALDFLLLDTAFFFSLAGTLCNSEKNIS